MSTTIDEDAGYYTNRARAAILAAVDEQHHVGGWRAADLGTSNALIAGRPEVREADLIRHFVNGTVGSDDAFGNDYATE
jgi:hypothetical protein